MEAFGRTGLATVEGAGNQQGSEQQGNEHTHRSPLVNKRVVRVAETRGIVRTGADDSGVRTERNPRIVRSVAIRWVS